MSTKEVNFYLCIHTILKEAVRVRLQMRVGSYNFTFAHIKFLFNRAHGMHSFTSIVYQIIIAMPQFITIVIQIPFYNSVSIQVP